MDIAPLMETLRTLRLEGRYINTMAKTTKACMGSLICGNCGAYIGPNLVCPVCGSKYVAFNHEGMEANEVPSLPLEEESKDKKYDSGKPMVGQMKKDFSKALLVVSDISRYGIEKYKKPGSWREVTDALSRYEDALGRHDLMSCYEDYDEESEFLHAAHRAWNALATLELILETKGEKKNECDW